jgi:Flp pilus assembly pilin Flp
MKMKSLRAQIKRFAQEETGQTTTEYILMLVVIVTIFVKFKKQLNSILGGLLGGFEQKTKEAMDEDN